MGNILEDIAGAGDLSDFAPNLDPGDHVVCLKLVEQRSTREYGEKIDVEFVVLESTCHQKGETRGDVFFIQRNGDAGLYARKRANAFSREVVKCLGGDPDDATPVSVGNKTMPKGQGMVVQTLGKLLDKTQPGRGIVLKISTKERLNKDKKANKNNTYSFVQQTREQIAQRRAKLESAPAVEAVAPAPAPQPTPAPAPAQPAAQTFNVDGLF